MRTHAFYLTAWLATATLGLTSGCVVAPPEPTGYVSTDVYVTSDPPPLIVEPIPVSPGIGYVWVGGAWVWRDHWVWDAGRWQRPPRPGAVWYPHRYENRNGQRVFVRGGWR
jgi:hypothetical protein